MDLSKHSVYKNILKVGNIEKFYSSSIILQNLLLRNIILSIFVQKAHHCMKTGNTYRNQITVNSTLFQESAWSCKLKSLATSSHLVLKSLKQCKYCQ